jgi:REP element-mobilizing transposase RayT
MHYNPNIHRRRSIRLKGYDYSQAGLYFVTICTQNKECLLGKIIDGEMKLNDAGRMVEKWYLELAHKFPDIELGEYVVMPNRFHAIIVNTGCGMSPVGADLCVCPNDLVHPILGEPLLGEPLLGEHIGSPLHAVVQWFKTMSTNEYIRGVKTLGWSPFNKKFWQRNYYEHIIRNEQSFQRIENYIINNPSNWNDDKLFTL